MKTPTFMIVPALACQASCNYCFGPHKGAIMNESTAKETIRFINNVAKETATDEISIVFHGGEPLLAPVSVWNVFFTEIKKILAGYSVRLYIQSNLWNLNDEFLRLFRENNVSVGTSLDGPEGLCDLNRGKGYFEKTYSSMKKVRNAGCPVSAIATITRQTLPHTLEIVKYFRNNGLSLMLHGALAGLDHKNSGFALNADEYAGMINGLFPWYARNSKHIKIDTLDYFVKGVVSKQPEICIFRNCLGMFLSISPSGDITSCQRLAGKKEFSMGNIADQPTLEALYNSPVAKAQQQREKQAAEKCKDCNDYPVCKGGCYYNALAGGDGIIDPLCKAYKEIYAFVRERVVEELFSAENMKAIIHNPAGKSENRTCHKGAYISLAHKTHPSTLANNARHILALYELSKTNSPYLAAQNLYSQKICGDVNLTGRLLADMQNKLHQPSLNLNNCYVHVSFDCNLRCSHCYAEAGVRSGEMDMEAFESLISQAITEKFRQVVITGGEPLVHSQRYELLDICKKYRNKGSRIVLRTNLTGSFSEDDFRYLAESVDEIIVSVDGNEETHNARRGKSVYVNMKNNLFDYNDISYLINHPAELSLACTMNINDIQGDPGKSVADLGRCLGVKKVRFRPLLPIGKASGYADPAISSVLIPHLTLEDRLKIKFKPHTTCGIGQNLFIHPNGDSYPCYAWCGKETYIGNVFENDLKTVLAAQQFQGLRDCSVDTTQKCKNCSYRYFCGGICRAWSNRQQPDLNTLLPHCEYLKEQAEKLISAAKEYLKS